MSDEDRNSRMVSTRGVRYKFTEGERVLCYEPDPTKAKVLYDSKVLGVVETKDKRGKKLIQYKIHFQGWNSSWDRRVNSDFVLKDTEENRQLQRDLAEKAQLQLAAYLYRREKRKRMRCSNNVRNRVSSEDRSSCSTFDRHESDLMKDEYDSEASSIESGIEEEKVCLQVGEKLKQILDFDRDMIVNKNKKHILPAKVPAISILENFVKQYALKLVFSIQTTNDHRRRNPQQKREIDFKKLNNEISLLKEFADGIRIYLDHTLKDHLLYQAEKEQGEYVLSEENLKNFTYVASEKNCFDLKLGTSLPPSGSENSESHSIISEIIQHTTNGRHNLRSHPIELDAELITEAITSAVEAATSSGNENCNARKASNNVVAKHENHHDSSENNSDLIPKSVGTSSAGSTPQSNAIPGNSDCPRTSPLNCNVSLKTRQFLQNVFSWQMLPSNAPAEASMIYGAVHLARLTSKLPDFLNATHMSDEKLNNLVRLLDCFSKYLESHKEWYGEQNYK